MPHQELDEQRAGGGAVGDGKPARLAGIDGLRALAAVWVVLFHIRAFSGARLLPGLDLFVRSGATGVSLFLVLSGFSLYLPFAGGKSSRFRAGPFLSRRCRRLLPAYYVSLAAIAVATVALHGRSGLAAFTAPALLGQLASHVALVHQLLPGGFYGLNGSYWSLGLEWELYLMLPIVIAAVRRFGLGRTVGTIVVITVAYNLLLATAVDRGLVAPHGSPATTVLPNLFVGRWSEFALGMVAAEVHAAGWLRGRGRKLWYLAIIAAPLALVSDGGPFSHPLSGVVFFVLVCVVLSGDNAIARVFSLRPFAALGLMSYSIYLVHQPLIQIGASVLRDHATPGFVFLGLGLLTPIVFAVAWLLFVTVERRALVARPTARLASVAASSVSARRLAPAGSLSPQPSRRP